MLFKPNGRKSRKTVTVGYEKFGVRTAGGDPRLFLMKLGQKSATTPRAFG